MEKKTDEAQATIGNIHFECLACQSSFNKEATWVSQLLEKREAECPDCQRSLGLGDEDADDLQVFLKKGERFGKAMMAFMLVYSLSGLVVSFLFGGIGFMVMMAIGIAIFVGLKEVFGGGESLSLPLYAVPTESEGGR